MLALVLTAWTSARAVWWENPFAPLGAALPVLIAQQGRPSPTTRMAKPSGQLGAITTRETRLSTAVEAASLAPIIAPLRFAPTPGRQRAQLAAAHHALWQTALRQPLFQNASFSLGPRTAQSPPPFLPASRRAPANQAGPANLSRWSLDAWAFWRQGSNGAPVSQGRVPIYGASQIGSLLQYRLAVKSGRDPRLYLRGYRALVTRGESEVALGASLRPVVKLPLRLAGEVRYTDAAFTNELRPSAFVVTELAPQRVPYGAQLEAYGQAGWVGGASATAFADGQVSLTRPVNAVAKATGDDLRLSFGAAVWGGAQEDAQRLDAGPTLRLDLTVGKVPARISIDWRERVAGQAGPDSGVAATVSARF
jgi:hypothetical protein